MIGQQCGEFHLNEMSVPAGDLAIRAAAPDWFRWAISSPRQSRQVIVERCPIHYLYWPAEPATSIGRGLLFVHGGGAHAQWWSFIAPYFMRQFAVAAIDLSGMGDSGRRDVLSGGGVISKSWDGARALLSHLETLPILAPLAA